MKKFSKCMRKMLSVFLTMVMVLTVFTVVPISANSANTEKELVGSGSGVQEKLNSILSVYPTGSYFTRSGGVCYSNQNEDCKLSNIPSRGGLPTGATAASVTRDAWSCCAFARYVFYCTFGINPENCSTVSASNARIGDYINFGSHYGIYLGQDSTYWYVYDSNYTSPASNIVKYNRALRKSNFSSVKIHRASNYDKINNPVNNTPVSFDTTVASDIGSNNATISTWVSNTGTITEMGFYIGSTSNYLEKIITNSSTVTWTRFHIVSPLSEYYSALSPGQKYYYQFYIVSNGEIYKADLTTFTTLGSSEISFDTYSLENVGEINARIGAWFSNSKGITLSSVGFCYGVDRNNLTKKEVSSNISWTRANLLYDLQNYVGMLNPNTTYYTRLYVVANGTTYYSDYINFKTNAKVTFDTYSISNTTTYNAMLGVWLSNPNAYTMDSIGFCIGMDKNCSNKVETKSNVQWTRPYLQYTIREYYSDLKPNVNYYLKYYVTIDEITYYSDIMSFYTDNDITFDTNNIENITATSANIKLWMSNEEGNLISSLGFLYGLDEDNMNKVETRKDVSWTRAYLDYTISDFSIQLKPNSEYYYKFYVVVGNNIYYSDCYSFTTKECTEHSYTSNVVNPTTEENGYTEHTCTICGDSYKDDYTTLGDINNDGTVSKADMYAWMTVYSNQIATAPTEYQLAVGDLNGNGEYDMPDKMMLNRLIA